MNRARRSDLSALTVASTRPLDMQLNPPGEDLRPWFQAIRDLDGPIDWHRVFGNDQPVEIDVGCGRGLFLYDESAAHPERNYVGIEIDFREGRRSASRLKKRNRANARVFGGDAREAFSKYVPPKSVAVVHVYCPDPWWKRRHRQRRIFTERFVDQLVAVLSPGGELSSASDVEEYFEVIRGLMNHDPRFEPVPLGERASTDGREYRTSFERKARQRGTTIHRGRWRLGP